MSYGAKALNNFLGVCALFNSLITNFKSSPKSKFHANLEIFTQGDKNNLYPGEIIFSKVVLHHLIGSFIANLAILS